jgi:hypothetical protein
MCVGTFSLEQEKDLDRHCNLLQGLATLVSSKITMQHGGKFGTTRLVTKFLKNLGISQVKFLLFFFPCLCFSCNFFFLL